MNDLILADAKTLMKQIVTTKGACVPAIIEDVRDALLFTKTKANILQEMVKGIENLEGAGEMQEAILDQRDEAKAAHLYMGVRFGEISEKIESRRGSSKTGISKSQQLVDAGISEDSDSARALASRKERMASNKWAVEEELKEKRGTPTGATETGVINRIREKESKAHADKQKQRADDRIVKETPRLVAEYLASIKTYREALDVAIAGAKRDKFDPNAWNFITKKHDHLRNLMAELEGVVNGQ